MPLSISLHIVHKAFEYMMQYLTADGKDCFHQLEIKLLNKSEECEQDCFQSFYVEALYTTTARHCFNIHDFINCLHGTEHFLTILQTKIDGPCISIRLTDNEEFAVSYNCMYCIDKEKWDTGAERDEPFIPSKIFLQFTFLVQEESIREFEYRILNFLQKISFLKHDILLSFISEDITLNSAQLHIPRADATTLYESSVQLFDQQSNEPHNVKMTVSCYQQSREPGDGHFHLSVIGQSASALSLDLDYWKILLETSLSDDGTLSTLTQVCEDHTDRPSCDWCHELSKSHQNKTLCVFIMFETEKKEHINTTFIQYVLRKEDTGISDQYNLRISEALKKALLFFNNKNCNFPVAYHEDTQYCKIMAASLVCVMNFSLNDEFQKQCLSLLKVSFKKEAKDKINKKLEEFLNR